MGLFTKKNHPLTGWLQWQEKLGKLEKGFFEKIGLEELEKDSLFVVLGWKSWIFIFDKNLIEYSIYS